MIKLKINAVYKGLKLFSSIVKNCFILLYNNFNKILITCGVFSTNPLYISSNKVLYSSTVISLPFFGSAGLGQSSSNPTLFNILFTGFTKDSIIIELPKIKNIYFITSSHKSSFLNNVLYSSPNFFAVSSISLSITLFMKVYSKYFSFV